MPKLTGTIVLAAFLLAIAANGLNAGAASPGLPRAPENGPREKEGEPGPADEGFHLAWEKVASIEVGKQVNELLYLPERKMLLALEYRKAKLFAIAPDLSKILFELDTRTQPSDIAVYREKLLAIGNETEREIHLYNLDDEEREVRKYFVEHEPLFITFLDSTTLCYSSRRQVIVLDIEKNEQVFILDEFFQYPRVLSVASGKVFFVGDIDYTGSKLYRYKRTSKKIELVHVLPGRGIDSKIDGLFYLSEEKRSRLYWMGRSWRTSKFIEPEKFYMPPGEKVRHPVEIFDVTADNLIGWDRINDANEICFFDTKTAERAPETLKFEIGVRHVGPKAVFGADSGSFYFFDPVIGTATLYRFKKWEGGEKAKNGPADEDAD